ncbi:MAG: glycerophosphodiester phosphodiesterase family protein [Ilumatobacteraceae bacterium]
MRCRGAVAAAAVIAALGLAACGSDAAPAATISTTTTAPTTTASAASSTAPSSTSAPSTTTTLPEVAVTPTTPSPAGATVAALLNLGRPVVLAHTGGEDEFPGSTLYAYGESVKAGVDVLDLNVMLTKDGVLVVQHDGTVDRLTESTGAVADMTYAELSRLDNAYWFTADGVLRDRPEADYVYRGIRTGAKPPPDGYTADDFAVPTMRSLIERSPTMPLNIEIEGSGEPAAAAARQLAAELRELGRLDASVVASFDDATVTYFHSLEPTVEMSPGFGASAAFVLDGTPLPDGMRILQLPPSTSGVEVLTPETIAKAHAAGYVIWVWPNDRTLENRAAYDQFLRDGIDGLNINFPAQGVAAARELVPTSG